jgi:hypothetical protein
LKCEFKEHTLPITSMKVLGLGEKYSRLSSLLVDFEDTEPVLTLHTSTWVSGPFHVLY